ncbi:MAG: SDR family oxidoreductase [Marinobacter sp.]|nr:SDR family oxidoreductase [Marinobacter sp.]
MTLLVTGATGYIGRHLCANLTANGHTVAAMLRNGEDFPALQTHVSALGGQAHRLQLIPGDLDQTNLGINTLPTDLTAIIHLGARFGWRLPQAAARRTNVDGSLAVARLAGKTGSRLVYASGFMLQNTEYLTKLGITGDEPDPINWRKVYKTAGIYEASKLEATLRIRHYTRCAGVDFVEVQPATIAGSFMSGPLDESQPLFELLNNLARGRFAFVPGTPAYWLPLVAVDYVARTLALAATEDLVPERLLALDPATPNLQKLLAAFATAMGMRPPTRHIPKGLLAMLLRIPGLPKLMNTWPEALHFIQPLRFDQDTSAAWLASHGIRHPCIAEVITNNAVAFSSKQKNWP